MTLQKLAQDLFKEVWCVYNKHIKPLFYGAAKVEGSYPHPIKPFGTR